MKKQEYIIDCRGLACPAPVLRAKETIEREAVDFLMMLVDNDAARENVSRFLSRAGYTGAAGGMGRGAGSGGGAGGNGRGRACSGKKPRREGVRTAVAKIMVLAGFQPAGERG